MTLVVFILLCVAVILLGAISSKPIGWIVLVLATLALLLAILGGVTLSVSR